MLLNLRRRAADERGYLMIVALGVLTVLGLLTVVAFAAAGGDVHLSRHDEDQKIAYAAAEAGVSDYAFHLNQDSSYWANCVPTTGPTAVNQYWNGSGADTRTNWRNVPGTGSRYAVELLPANGKTSCDKTNAQASMIDTATGTFRIRSTGVSGDVRRSIVATFKRRSFLDYIYFTDYETSDPSWASLETDGNATRSGSYPSYSGPDYPSWVASTCAKTYWRGGRGDLTWTGQRQSGTSWQSLGPLGCTEIQFAPGDKVNGPFHTNDEINLCGSPIFGRTTADQVEVSGDGWRKSDGCSSASPNFKGTWSPGSPVLTMPPSNQSLKRYTDAGYVFTGKTTIRLGTSSITVNGRTMNYPAGGVIYVANGNCGTSYDPFNPSGDPSGCGDATVSGTYGNNLTITAEKDILVDGDITRSGDSMLGLIANDFIRINHPASHSSDPSNCTNSSGTMTNVRVDAAILSLNHSFTVDNYYCGAALGTLTVNGAIAQAYRGPVGTSNGTSVASGYLKNYTYDDRLRFREPPHFLDPVQAGWRVQRYREQSPAS